MSHAITFVCALPSEARALIDHYALREEQTRPFRCYADAHRRLIVSGMGCHASACAVGFAAGRRHPQPGDIWLNVGIAGHRDCAIGTALLAGSVRHASGGNCYYPGLGFASSLPVMDVLSHDQAVNSYPADAACDMEAAGFMAASSRIAEADCIQVFKIVSDNAHQGVDKLSRKVIERLVAAQIPALDALSGSLLELTAKLPADAHQERAEDCFAHCHFTFSERQQLAALRRRHHALCPAAAWPPDGAAGCRSAQEALALIHATLDVHLARWEP